VHRHSDGEITLEVELPLRPCLGRTGPARVRVIVTDCDAD
jgi:hypothetical protein